MPARNISEYPQLLNAIHSAEKIVYLCGAGASMSLGSHRLSWTNWIAEGRKYLTIPEQNELNLKIGSWTAEELIDAATFLLGKLKSSGAYQTFMNQTIGALHPVNTEFKEALSMQKYKLYNALEQNDNAFKEVEKLAAKFPMESRYQIILGDLHLEKNDTVKALKYYQKAHEIDPESPYYIVSMANYYEVVGNKDAAETQIRNALVNEKLDVDTKVGILSRYILKLQQTKKGTESANALFQTLLEQHPEDTDLKQMYGSLLVAQGKTDEARFQFQLITEMEPSNAAAWQQLLNLALKSEDIPEVIRICTRCQELFPDAPEYYFYLGIAYFQQEKYQDALDTYKAGLEIIPETNVGLKSDFYGQIGDIYYQIKNMPEAYKAYDEALKYNDKNVVVLNNYAYFLSLEKKDLKKAERMSALAVKLEPNNSTYLDTYAWIFFVQGNYTLAKIYIESALANDTTKSSELVDHYGDILFMSGDKEKALEQWKKAKEMGKESDVLDRKIAEGTYIEEEVKNE